MVRLKVTLGIAILAVCITFPVILKLAHTRLGIKPLGNLATADYEKLAEAVKHFDPKPWTTHVGPPIEPEPLDLATQTKNMAQTIRILDSYKENPELHALPDGLMIFMWALQANPDVEILQDQAL